MNSVVDKFKQESQENLKLLALIDQDTKPNPKTKKCHGNQKIDHGQIAPETTADSQEFEQIKNSISKGHALSKSYTEMVHGVVEMKKDIQDE